MTDLKNNISLNTNKIWVFGFCLKIEHFTNPKIYEISKHSPFQLPASRNLTKIQIYKIQNTNIQNTSCWQIFKCLPQLCVSCVPERSTVFPPRRVRVSPCVCAMVPIPHSAFCTRLILECFCSCKCICEQSPAYFCICVCVYMCLYSMVTMAHPALCAPELGNTSRRRNGLGRLLVWPVYSAHSRWWAAKSPEYLSLFVAQNLAKFNMSLRLNSIASPVTVDLNNQDGSKRGSQRSKQEINDENH